MSDDADVEELRRDIDQIKSAMGIGERYPGGLRLWLVYGVLVPIAALASQAIATFDLPGWGHWLAWGLTMGAAGVYQAVALGDRDGLHPSEPRPNIALAFGGVFAYALVVIAVVSPVLDTAAAGRVQATVFGIAVAGVGAAYVLGANALAAYRIRRRDRLAFAAGGPWMFALALAMAYVPVFRQWGYAAFGLGFAVHAVAASLLLRTGGASA
jgi:FtsH-binding integral membrane protein